MRSKKQSTLVPGIIRQGDVLLIRADVDLHGARHVPRDGDRLVLAYGEVTGHALSEGELRRVIEGEVGGGRHEGNVRADEADRQEEGLPPEPIKQ